jgi:beta-galactosidase
MSSDRPLESLVNRLADSAAERRLTKIPHFLYGGDYNPEQWPEETWEEDVRLMRDVGVNLVTLGVFSWARLEPTPGNFEFGWLDRVLELLERSGVWVDLATATASPPPWLAKLRPESLPVTREGTKLWPGSRQHYCPSSEAYREAASRLVENMAERYGKHPDLAMWHVNNEYGCHVPACYCDVSAEAFREWLQDRYGSIEALNEAWNTAFWSQGYSDWAEICPPRATPTFMNPSHELDFARFSNSALMECFELERSILERITPAIPVTTNFMSFFKPCDYWQWARREDVVSNDAYPDPSSPETPAEAAMGCDLMRSLARGPWVLMEQAASNVNWRRRNAPKRPGQMRALSYQAVGRGAEGIMFFQWRQSRAGAEKYHSAIVSHSGPSSSRVYAEARTLGNELAGLDDVVGSRVEAQVGIIFDWPNWWALELPAKPNWDIGMIDQLFTYYLPLFEANIPADFVPSDGELDRYKVVFVPNLYLVRDEAAANLTNYVISGGTLVMSFFSGIVDELDHVRLGGYPAPFRETLGIHIGEFAPMVDGETYEVEILGHGTFSCDLWNDRIDLAGAEALATYRSGWLKGSPAVTRCRFREGSAYYIGTRLDREAMTSLLRDIAASKGVNPALTVPAGVEVVRRTAPERDFLFVINHGRTSAEISLERSCFDRATGREMRELSLDPLGVAILEETY